ncbi:MAG: ABC transporter substrate-binding protein [Actinomycetota bacterium]|nr:ABC transporter substrate-binding protein [Actinomycetota bacterium]
MTDQDSGVLGPYPRRDFLRQAVGGAAVIGAGGMLAACGSTGATAASTSGRSSAPAASSSSASTKPKRGGTITLAATGGGSSDTLDGDACVNTLDFARAPQLYDTLMETTADNVIYPHLAEEVTSNADATVWTIRLRKGIEFHDGKPLTIDDVLFTFQRILTNKLSAAASLANLELKSAKKLDAYTVQIPLTQANALLPWDLIGNGEISIVPVGYNPKKPVGTGPFVYKSFTPGEQSVFTRNPNYFLTGEPYVDEVVIVDYTDQASQVDALISGAATCVSGLTVPSVPTVKGGGKVAIIWKSPGWVPFTMRLDKAPFNDPDVRMAMRLVVDRPQMREVVNGGYGFVGNDVFGISYPDYDTALPQRVQDIDKAKYLLKKSGHEKLTVELVTSDIANGAIESATVLKQQAAAAGITINLNTVTSTTFFGPNYLRWTFAQDWWSGYPYLRQAGYSMVPGAPWDETHWDTSPYGSKYLSLYKQALAQPDVAKQNELAHELMKMDYDYGGYIIPTFNPIIVGQSKALKGVVDQDALDPWIEYRFRTLWLD